MSPDRNKGEDRARDQLVDAVARCLAKIDGPFIGAVDWAGVVGDSYRDKARQVLRTVENFNAGIRSGGLPPSKGKRNERDRGAAA